MIYIYINTSLLDVAEIRHLYTIGNHLCSNDTESSDDDVSEDEESSVDSPSRRYNIYDECNYNGMKCFSVQDFLYRDVTLRKILNKLSNCWIVVISDNIKAFTYILSQLQLSCRTLNSKIILNLSLTYIEKLNEIDRSIDHVVFKSKKMIKDLTFPDKIHSITIKHTGDFIALCEIIAVICKLKNIVQLNIHWCDNDMINHHIIQILYLIKGSNIQELYIPLVSIHINYNYISELLVKACSESKLLYVNILSYIPNNDKRIIQLLHDTLPTCVIYGPWFGTNIYKKSVIKTKCYIIKALLKGNMCMDVFSLDEIKMLIRYIY